MDAKSLVKSEEEEERDEEDDEREGLRRVGVRARRRCAMHNAQYFFS